MILPGFPALISRRSSGGIFPAVTVGRADIFGDGAYFGYIRPGGPVSATLDGFSGGTLSGTLVSGYVTDAVISISGLGVGVYVVGDCTALLTGVTALMDNGTPLLAIGPAEYFSDYGFTVMSFNGSWTSTGNRTVQLV